MKTNKKTPVKKTSNVRLAGGSGMLAALQSNEQALKRTVLACLLWEDNFYQDKVSSVEEIKRLVPLVSGRFCADLAIEAREMQKLRHVPLMLIREMCRYDSHRPFVREAVNRVCTRPDQLTELLSLYWLEGKKPLAKQLKLGLADALLKFDRYQISKWNRDADIKLRDILFLTHPKPQNEDQAQLFKDLAEGTLTPADTWEVKRSAAKNVEDKKAIWKDLISRDKLGALAVLRNLRNMQQDGLDKATIRKAISQSSASMLLPIDFIKAADYAPDYLPELQELMFRCLAQYPKIKGETIFVLDVSGSMGSRLSSKSDYNRMEAGMAMAMMAAEVCEHCTIYLTAGSDIARKHSTQKIASLRGFGLLQEIRAKFRTLGGGGIFTRQCLDYLRTVEKDVDNIIIFSDSQDCDLVKTLPSPFGKKNYIVDVSGHTNGINYKGVWTAEISGWSENFLRYIACQ